ncbi:MAG: prepilin-type N-terminal cleavage/methylation domain-containing protein [Candidatus Riflebacteria bacterium]|nr:prepilin-type N-terminal cleavage/methylation domain-containing protein [Candidatus Riflebacteria bacterium]
MNTKKTVILRRGFTLMEIMVVIIVVAVLASVAGPMISGITEQGRSTATKSAMSNLKSALMSFNQDQGRYPYLGMNGAASYNSLSINGAFNSELAWNNDLNVLSCSVSSRKPLKWKGPYMEGPPTEFMCDAWDEPIEYYEYKGQIYLHSKGSDLSKDTTADILLSNYAGDDILMSIGALRK